MASQCSKFQKLVLVMPEHQAHTSVTFQDLSPYNYDIFDYISGEIAMDFRRLMWRQDVEYCPDIYLVTYDTGKEVVESSYYPGGDKYRRPEFGVEGEGQRHRSPVPAFEMRMLSNEVREV
jgi:hypothetical protein